jgi:hypothetical protein
MAVFLIGFSVLVAACAPLSGYPEEVADPEKEVTNLVPYFDPAVTAKYSAMTDPVQREQYRNEVVYGRLRAFDIRFNQFAKAITQDNSVFAIGTDWLVLALNAAGATTGGLATKSALAAASAGIVGAKGAVDKDLFYQKTLPVLLATMEARRLTALVPIMRGLKRNDAQYSLYEALVDLGVYETAGSIPGAINGLVKEAGEEAAQAQADIKEIKFERNEGFVAGRVDALPIQDRLNKLTDEQALAVATAMEPVLTTRSDNIQTLMKAKDPSGQHLKSGSEARDFLLLWQIQDERDAASIKQWADALDAVGG